MLSKKNTAMFYDSIAAEYDALKSSSVSIVHKYLLIPNLLRVLPDVNGKRVIDLGCGTGIISSLLAKKGAEVTGIDISKNMTEIAKTKVKNARFLVEDIEDMNLPSEYFDIGVCVLAMDYIRDIGRSLREINRVLKKGGTIILVIRNPLVSSTKPIDSRHKHIRKFYYYFREYKIRYAWNEFHKNLVDYEIHRPMENFTKQFVSNGFIISYYFDLKPMNPKNKNKGWVDYNLRVPKFCGFKLVKSQRS
ncbi:class I SAM-dependent methyltransferase [Candidatus Marsarchaeota archaeon]|nr:class I SAM-dependent methyltransferase [Candidatus Marsarchaeota archaeon]